MDANSAYVPLLFAGIEDEFTPVYRTQGSLEDAMDDMDRGTRVIVHVHWEEFVLRDCRSQSEATAAASAFVAQIGGISERRGPIVWTVHNLVPHEIPYREQCLAMRAALARDAGVILVHDARSNDALAAQVAFDPARVRTLPHPSYLGRFEDEAALRAGLDRPPRDRRIQAFGHIRLQKGLAQMIEMLPAAFLQSRDAYVRVSGRGPETAAVVAQVADRIDVHWDVRHVPDAETPELLRSASCVVLPYERMLTSGVALLAMSVGALVVAVDFPQLRALLPPESLRFLYAAHDAAALRRIVDDVLSLSPRERRAIVDANLSVARGVTPDTIARRLAAIYREIARR